MKRSTMPSLAALLGLLAVAGYQNRDKLGQLLKSATVSGPGAEDAPEGTPGPSHGVVEDVVKGIADIFSGTAPHGSLLGGLADVVDSLRNAGQAKAADSWVATGANQPVTPAQTEAALGGDLIDMLVKQTGLSREDLLARLSKILPEAVDKMSPEGHLPEA